MQLRGEFQITGWDESNYSEGNHGVKQSHAKITQSYTGDIEGNSELQYLMSYQSSQSAIFVGIEKVTATLQGKQGSFVLQHNGKFEDGVASSQFTIVPHSGQGELTGLQGEGTFRSGEGGKAQYQFNDVGF